MGSEFRWIMGSIGVVIVFGLGLLTYGIIDSNRSMSGTKATIDADIVVDRYITSAGSARFTL